MRIDNVYFVNDPEQQSESTYVREEHRKPNSLYLKPLYLGWKQKYQFEFLYIYYHSRIQESPIVGDTQLGFVGHSVEEILEKSNNKEYLINANDLPNFYTILRSDDAYRELISGVGMPFAKELMQKINDLVYLKAFNEKTTLLDKAIKSKPFNEYLRSSKASFYALFNAENLFKVERFYREIVDDGISTSFSVKYKLSNFDHQIKINFNFKHESLLPNNVAVLIGENGLGKSQAINNIAKYLIKPNERYLYDDRGAPPKFNKLLSLITPGEVFSTFPFANANSSIPYSRISTGGRKRKHDRDFGTSIIELFSRKQYIGNISLGSVFIRAMFLMRSSENLVIETSRHNIPAHLNEIHINGKTYISIISLLDELNNTKGSLFDYMGIYGADNIFYLEENNVYPVSSGQKAFIQFALKICVNIDVGTLVLIDEPETHLHPNFITEFVNILIEILQATNSFAIIATHSAYFVREVDSKQVYVFKNNNGVIEVTEPLLRTFGAPVGEISHFVFEDHIHSIQSNQIVSILKDKYLGRSKEELRKAINELSDKLSLSMMSYIKTELLSDERD